MAALEAGIHGLRINPGNIKYQDKVRLIAREAKARGVPIRIGVNAGSLEKDLLAKYGRPTPEALVESALNEARILEDEEFFDIKISVKHATPSVMIQAYRLLAEKCDYPLHLGVTEAGPMPAGGIKSAVGIGTLLAEGIGDTIRVSLTDDPVEEVKAGTWILQSLGLRQRGLDLVACPSCGRAEVNVLKLTKEVNEGLERAGLKAPNRATRIRLAADRVRRFPGPRGGELAWHRGAGVLGRTGDRGGARDRGAVLAGPDHARVGAGSGGADAGGRGALRLGAGARAQS